MNSLATCTAPVNPERPRLSSIPRNPYPGIHEGLVYVGADVINRYRRAGQDDCEVPLFVRPEGREGIPSKLTFESVGFKNNSG